MGALGYLFTFFNIAIGEEANYDEMKRSLHEKQCRRRPNKRGHEGNK